MSSLNNEPQLQKIQVVFVYFLPKNCFLNFLRCCLTLHEGLHGNDDPQVVFTGRPHKQWTVKFMGLVWQNIARIVYAVNCTSNRYNSPFWAARTKHNGRPIRGYGDTGYLRKNLYFRDTGYRRKNYRDTGNLKKGIHLALVVQKLDSAIHWITQLVSLILIHRIAIIQWIALSTLWTTGAWWLFICYQLKVPLLTKRMFRFKI